MLAKLKRLTLEIDDQTLICVYEHFLALLLFLTIVSTFPASPVLSSSVLRRA